MTPHSKKLLDLVQRLSARTVSGSIGWRVSQDGHRAFTELNSGTVEIRPDKDNSGQDAIRITVYDGSGEVKLTFDDTAIEDWDQNFGNSISHFSDMSELFDAALRSGRGEDQVLNSLLSELEDDDVPF